MLIILLQSQKVKSIGRELKVLLWCEKVSLEAILVTPMQYILLLATVIKCIAPTTFNHIINNIFDFLLAPLYILFLAGTIKKAKMLYIIYSKMLHILAQWRFEEIL